ncbi:hypothetical protein ACVWXO_001821 [Bradyrhizobium sp. LM2.7]
MWIANISASALLLAAVTVDADAQAFYRRGPTIYRGGPIVRYAPMTVPRPLPRPTMGPVYYPPGVQSLGPVAPRSNYGGYYPSTGYVIPGQTAQRLPYMCDRFGRCWTY